MAENKTPRRFAPVSAEDDLCRRPLVASGTFELSVPPDKAFPLFTAAGEERWIDDWRPTYLGKKEPQSKGLVFITGAAAERTIWTVLETDPAKGRLAYSRVTPESRAGIVEVELAAHGRGTRVQVTYTMTALSPETSSHLHQFAPRRFPMMLEEWRTMINRALRLD